jgi:V8-like Glu-specific endopeptidase
MRLAVVFILVGCAAPVPPTPSLFLPYDRCEDSRAVIHPSVVKVRAFDALCTGVTIGPAEVLTSAHCVEEKGQPWVEYQGKKFLSTFVSMRGPDQEDLALIGIVPDFSLFSVPVTMAPYQPSTGEVVQIVGYGCDAEHKEQRMRRLVVHRTTDISTEIPMKGCTCKGDSGGPAFNSQGQLIGVNWTGSPSLTYAIDPHIANYLRNKR